MSDVTVTRIPLPRIILKGTWGDIVYLIETSNSSLNEHEAQVQEEISKIVREYDNNNHHSVSLRKVKQEVVYNGDFYCRFASLVQFRVRDSY